MLPLMKDKDNIMAQGLKVLLHLEEELASFVKMEISPGGRAPDEHDIEILLLQR